MKYKFSEDELLLSTITGKYILSYNNIHFTVKCLRIPFCRNSV